MGQTQFDGCLQKSSHSKPFSWNTMKGGGGAEGQRGGSGWDKGNFLLMLVSIFSSRSILLNAHRSPYDYTLYYNFDCCLLASD